MVTFVPCEDDGGLGSCGGAKDNDTIYTDSGSSLDDIDTTVSHPVRLRKWFFSATLT